MSQLLNGGKYRISEKEPDPALELNLRQWMTARPSLLDPEVQPLFERLYEFAGHVQSEGFASVVKNLAGEIADCLETLDLTELIGESLCQGIRDGDNGVERKSLQEMLYFCTGIVPDLPPAEFGKRLESFLALNGSKGFIRIFLSVYLSNLIFSDLNDSLQAYHPEVMRGRMAAIERLCHKAAAAAVRSLNTWSEPNPSSVAALLSDLKTGITRILGGSVPLHRGA